MNASQITFGTEIETMISDEYIRYGDYQMGHSHLGTGSAIYTLPDGWTGKRDGSIGVTALGSTVPNGFRGIEVVSPVMSGEEGLTQVVYACDDLSDIKAYCDKTCGGHIHVGRPDSIEVQERVAKLFYRYQQAFFGANGAEYMNRINNSFCSMVDHQISTITRYRALNWTNGATVEFRLFAATTDALALIARIQMCVALVAYAYENDVRWSDVDMIQDIEESMKEFQTKIMSKHPIVSDCGMSDIKDHLTRKAKKAKASMMRLAA